MVICFFLSKTQCLSTETTLVSICYLETIKSDGMQRPNKVICSFPETAMSFDRDYCNLHFIIQRQTSLMVCGDDDGHPFLIVFFRFLQFPLLSRDSQVRWHAGTNMVICSLCRGLNVCRLRLLKSLLLSRDNRVRWHAKTITVIHFFIAFKAPRLLPMHLMSLMLSFDRFY